MVPVDSLAAGNSACLSGRLANPSVDAKQLRLRGSSRGCFVSEEIMVWRTLDEALREYYSFLVSSVPLQLIEALRRQLDITQVTDAEYWQGVASRREGRLNEKPLAPDRLF